MTAEPSAPRRLFAAVADRTRERWREEPEQQQRQRERRAAALRAWQARQRRMRAKEAPR